ncbi:MAG: carboxylesterase family protein [Bdellovibrionales bacterium]|nr:carboxylesterase family protein [Bdellovibrionales bacterium]
MASRVFISTSISFVLLALGFLFINATSSNGIIGYFSGFVKTPSGYSIAGWSCEVGVRQQIDVEVFTQGLNSPKMLLKRVKANQSFFTPTQTSNIDSLCGTSGIPRGFKINLSYSEVININGLSLSAEAIGSSNKRYRLIQNSYGSAVVNLDNELAFTQYGWVRGLNEPSPLNSVVSFKGIPYAKPPLGKNRWRRTLPPSPWINDRITQSFSKACMQDGDLLTTNPSDQVKLSLMSEDCLTINVWKPKNKANLPVVVYIHGGRFVKGSSSLKIYDGAALASQNVIFVSFNYRVGVFGFFSHSHLRSPTYNRTGINFALSDQHDALTWVQNNISEFGGDPNNITLMGSSAGGASVGYWMANDLGRPPGQELFHRAIMESGGASFTQAGTPPLTTKQLVARSFNWADSKADKMIDEIVRRQDEFFTTYGSNALPDCVKNYSNYASLPSSCVDDLLFKSAAEVFRATSYASSYFTPYFDDYYVKGGTADRFAQGLQKNIPFITGSMGWEASVIQADLDQEEITYASQTPIYQNHFYGLYPQDYLNNGYGNFLTERGLAEAVYADRVFGATSRMLAQYHSKINPNTYWYFFDYVGSGMPFYKGAPHHILNAFVFNTLSTTLKTTYNPDQTDLIVAKQWSGYWLSFIKGKFNSDNTMYSDQFGSKVTTWYPLRISQENRLTIIRYGQPNNIIGDAISRNRQKFLKQRYDYIDQQILQPCLISACIKPDY